MTQLTPIEAEMQAGQFNEAMRRGNTAEVERLNPLFTLYNGALVRKDQLAGFQNSGATVSGGQVIGAPIKFAIPPAGMLPGAQAIAQAIPNPTGIQQGGITSSNGMSPTQLTSAIQNQNQPLVFSQAVKDEQIALNAKGANLKTDGLLGPLTLAARAQFGGTISGGATGGKAPDDPTNQFNTATGQSNPKYVPPTSVVGTSTTARTTEADRQAGIAKAKAELEAGAGPKPTPFDALTTLDTLRATTGQVKNEEELNTIQDAMRQAQEELNQFKQTSGKEIGMGGYLGGISEAERNMNFRLSSLALRESAVIGRINASNVYINQAMAAGQQTYVNAKNAWDTEYTTNAKAIEMYNTNLSNEEKDALTGFTTFTNLIKDGNMEITPALTQELGNLLLKSGIPMTPETINSVIQGLKDKKGKIMTVKEVDTATGKDVYFYYEDGSVAKIQHMAGTGGTGGGTEAERKQQALQAYSTAFVVGAKLSDGTPILDNNGFITPIAWKQAIADYKGDRADFIKKYGYLVYQKDGVVDSKYGLTTQEQKLITG